MTYKYVPIAKEETYTLLRQAQRGDQDAKTLLIRQNTGLVKKIASKFVSSEDEMEDLIQIGYMGLLKAIERFDTKYDVMFSTYAVPMIMGEIKRFFRDNGKLKVSRTLKREIQNLKRIQDEWMAQKGKLPRISQMADAMGVSTERILEIMEAADALHNMTSLDQQLVEQEYRRSPGMESPESHLSGIMIRDQIALLKEKERLVVILRYYKDMTQQQIAERLGVSQVQVSRIEKQALMRIRKAMEE